MNQFRANDDRRKRLREVVGSRVLVIDGAMGTMIQRLGLLEADYRAERFREHPRPLKGNNDLLCLTRADDIERIHRAYLEAGADIIETNSFNATSVSQQDFGLPELAFELNVAAARIARRAADAFSTPERPRFVAGAIGPTNQTLSLSRKLDDPSARELDFGDMQRAYAEQIRGLLEGGADLLLIETIFDTLNAKAAIAAALEVQDELGLELPLMLSLTVSDTSRRCLSGQGVAAFAISVAHARPLAIGLNCGLGAEQMSPLLEELRQHFDGALLCYPNAGLPNAFGGYDQTPEQMAEIIAKDVQRGLLDIAGGCCGTTPEFIRAIAHAVDGLRPLRHPPAAQHLRLSGLDPSIVRPELGLFMLGERSNVMGSRHFARLVRARSYEQACALVRQQVESGANAIDVCMDDDQLDAKVAIREFLRWLGADASVARLPVVVDSSRFEVIETALQELQGKSLVNSLSLKDGEAIFLHRARIVRRLGAALIVMAADERGQASHRQRRVEILARSFELLTRELGFEPEDIVFDPNVLSIATGVPEHSGYALDFIETCAELRALFPRCPIIGGISNLSFAFRGQDHIREAMHSVFLHHAMAAGLNMAIVNTAQLVLLDAIEPALREAVEDLVLDRQTGPQNDATERLLGFTRTASPSTSPRLVDEAWRAMPTAARLEHALIHGRVEFLEQDLREASTQYASALALVEGPLMAGMNAVGQRFAAGEMFLPQVVKTARVMKQAVELLEPLMQQGERSSAPRPAKILLATVKGDVHDIGKSIVAVVLGCNGYEVIDLGVQVPADVIVRQAIEAGVDAIGLSALISPSLDEMVEVARQLELAGLTLPLLIGGATTSARHTALKLAPVYSGPCVHVSDASRAPEALSRFLQPARRVLSEAELRIQQKKIVEQHQKHSSRPILTLAAARENALRSDWETLRIAPAPTLRSVFEPSLEELMSSIDWEQLLQTWRLSGQHNQAARQVAADLLADARALLARRANDGLKPCRAAFRLMTACSDGDDVLLLDEHGQDLARLPMLRQQRVGAPGRANLCLSDYLGPRATPSTCGLFAVGIFGMQASAGEEPLLLDSVANLLAEAGSAWLHQQLERVWPAASMRPAIGYPSCPDHSLKAELFALLDPEGELGIELSESFMMRPAASVCGLYLAHPEARLFAVGRIDEEQLEDYARRRGVPLGRLRRWLAP